MSGWGSGTIADQVPPQVAPALAARRMFMTARRRKGNASSAALVPGRPAGKAA